MLAEPREVIGFDEFEGSDEACDECSQVESSGDAFEGSDHKAGYEDYPTCEAGYEDPDDEAEYEDDPDDEAGYEDDPVEDSLAEDDPAEMEDVQTPG